MGPFNVILAFLLILKNRSSNINNELVDLQNYDKPKNLDTNYEIVDFKVNDEQATFVVNNNQFQVKKIFVDNRNEHLIEIKNYKSDQNGIIKNGKLPADGFSENVSFFEKNKAYLPIKKNKTKINEKKPFVEKIEEQISLKSIGHNTLQDSFSLPNKNANTFPNVTIKDPYYTNGAITSEVPIASELGIEILQKGGNAVDAAIASTICIGIINSFSSGVGGGGFMLIKKPKKEGENVSFIDTIDFRETAPEEIKIEEFNLNQNVPSMKGLKVGVPGEIKGLYEAHKKYGKLPWSTLFERNIEIADGFPVSSYIHNKLIKLEKYIFADPGLKAIYTKNGKLLKTGDIISRKNYKQTLEKIAVDPESFYNGDLADRMVTTIKEKGGVISKKDFEMYNVHHRSAIASEFMGYSVYSTNLPSGGVFLLQGLNIMENFDFIDLEKQGTFLNNKELDLFSPISKKSKSDFITVNGVNNSREFITYKKSDKRFPKKERLNEEKKNGIILDNFGRKAINGNDSFNNHVFQHNRSFIGQNDQETIKNVDEGGYLQKRKCPTTIKCLVLESIQENISNTCLLENQECTGFTSDLNDASNHSMKSKNKCYNKALLMQYPHYHVLIEILKFINAKRGRYADPAFLPNWKEVVEETISKETSRKIFEKIDVNRVLNELEYEPEGIQNMDYGTTHLNVVDKDGMIVSVTSTINLEFGAKFMCEETGIIFNDQMGDFSIPNDNDILSFPTISGNMIQPGKRPFSSASSLILERDNETIVLGGTGGFRIPSTILGVIFNMLRGQSIEESIDNFRLHHQFLPNITFIENAFDKDIEKYLNNLGHKTELFHDVVPANGVYALHITNRNGDMKINAISDKRRYGMSCGY